MAESSHKLGLLLPASSLTKGLTWGQVGSTVKWRMWTIGVQAAYELWDFMILKLCLILFFFFSHWSMFLFSLDKGEKKQKEVWCQNRPYNSQMPGPGMDLAMKRPPRSYASSPRKRVGAGVLLVTISQDIELSLPATGKSWCQVLDWGSGFCLCHKQPHGFGPMMQPLPASYLQKRS